jgi:hypothetical protein
MVQKRRFHPARRDGRSAAPGIRGLREPPAVTERPAPVVYGKPFILLEDQEKNTFIFQAGQWVPHDASIAQCRQTCQVKELPQRVNRMIRYEVRRPLHPGS